MTDGKQTDGTLPSQIKNKLAYCFLVYDGIECEPQWMEYFAAADRTSFNVYVHAKERDASRLSTFVKQHLIPEHISTEHSSISLVQATNALFRHAFHADTANQVFILLSGSCLPIKPMSSVQQYFFIDRPGISVVPASPPEQSLSHWKSLLLHLPRQVISKHHQWIILQREWVDVFKDNPMLHCFRHVWCPDEHYYLTMMRYLCHQQGKSMASVEQCEWPHFHRQPTFVHWPDIHDSYPFKRSLPAFQGRYPLLYESMALDEWQYLEKHCTPFPFFMRKVGRGFVVHSSPLSLNEIKRT